MFYLLVIPGILQERPQEMAAAVQGRGVISMDTYVDERAGMERPIKPQDAAAEAAYMEEQDVTRLYEQFRRPIHSYVYRLLGNQEDADDVTQEVFVRAFTQWDGLYERERLSPWLYRIATNLCVDQLRRRKRISWWPLSLRRRNNDPGEEFPDDASYLLTDAGGIPEIAEREHIQLALDNMPEEYAVVLVLSAAQGVPYQEVATIVGISPNAAATRISRAKKMFAMHYQRLLAGHGETQDEVRKRGRGV